VVRWTATDALSGIAAAPPDVTVGGEGAALWATTEVFDRAGNDANTNVGPFKIDRTAPLTTVSAPADWQSRAVTVTLDASDGLSGVAATYFSVDGGEVQAGARLLLETEGQHTVRFWSVDAAGNAEVPKLATVKIDLSAPTIA